MHVLSGLTFPIGTSASSPPGPYRSSKFGIGSASNSIPSFASSSSFASWASRCIAGSALTYICRTPILETRCATAMAELRVEMGNAVSPRYMRPALSV